MNLWRASGMFVVHSGTDRVIRVHGTPTTDLRGDLDLYELLYTRRVIDLTRKEFGQSISQIGGSMPMLMASTIRQLLVGPRCRRGRVTNINETFGSILEALIALDPFRSLSEIRYDARFRDDKQLRGFFGLHRKRSSTKTTFEVGETRVEPLSGFLGVGADYSDLAFANLLLEPADSLDVVLNRQFGGGSPTPSPILLLARVSADGRVPVVDVLNQRSVLPGLGHTIGWCLDRGLAVSYLFLNEVDRPFLLPFEGRYGIAALYVSPTPGDHFLEFGFRAGDGEPSMSDRNLPSIVANGSSSYHAALELELVDRTSDNEPDWDTWRAQRDWDPGLVDWNAVPQQGDLLVYAAHRSGADKDVIRLCELVRSNISLSPPNISLSPHGLVLSAYGLRGRHEAYCLYCCFAALHKAGHDPDLAEFLARTAGGQIDERVLAKARKVEPQERAEALLPAVVDLAFAVEWIRSSSSLQAFFDAAAAAYGRGTPEFEAAERAIDRSYKANARTAISATDN